MSISTQALLDQWKVVESTLNSKFQAVTPFKEINVRTSIPPAHVFAGFGAIVLLLVAFNIGGAFFTTLIGFAFPAYKSLVAIESTNKADDTQWLAYWVMFASFSVAELFLDLGTHVPFYYLAKLVFLMWCFLPSTQGALLIYNRSLRPLVLQYASIPAAPAGAKQE